MSDADRSQYADEVTQFSQSELQELLEVASPPVCLLGGWAVHIQVTDAFEKEHGRQYIGSRDIDLGVHVDPSWDAETVSSKPVTQTLDAIESEMNYNRGRFGFYQYFHRTTKERLTDEQATAYPQHEIFRLDVDILPSTTKLEGFETAVRFRPPAEPLLETVFADDNYDILDEHVDWEAPLTARLAPRSLLAAMKVRALPERDKSHKRLKDLADLHALVWYGTDFDQIRQRTVGHLNQKDIAQFEDATAQKDFENAARLIGVDPDMVRNSIQQLLV